MTKGIAKAATFIGIAAISAMFFAGGLLQAQSDNPKLLRAHAAGYRAQFMCSGLFNGGKTLAQIERDELTGIYPHIAKIVPKLETKIEPKAKKVSVKFADDMPPRIALHNDITGCTALPIGSVNARPTRIRGTRLEPGALDDENWPIGDVNARKKDRTGIGELEKIAENMVHNRRFGGKTSALLILKNGRIVAEDYMQGHDKHTGQRTWSVAKSITSTYVGYVRQKTGSNFGESGNPEKSPDPRRDIGIDTLLRMASGMHSDTAGSRTDHIYMGGGNVREWATPFPLLHRPGTVFRYANNDTLIAMLKARREAPRLHPHDMFDQLGMTRSFAETDPIGDYVSSSQMWTTARDMARLGLLYINNGLWPDTGPDAARVLPEDWRSYVSSASGPQPKQGNFGYGAQFWLINASVGIPKDSFAAFGNRGQFLVIIPSRSLVVVRRGYDSPGDRFDIESAIRNILLAV